MNYIIFIMVNKVQKKVKRHFGMGKLKKLITRHEQEASVLNKLHFIRLLYKGIPTDKACEIEDISLSTGHRWLDEWNEGGYEGLYPKYKNGGRKAKLRDEQFQELDEIMRNETYLTTRKVHKIIKDTFNVEYSMKRVVEIVHKLGYSYKKGYILYSKMPKDAKITLKKTKKLQS